MDSGKRLKQFISLNFDSIGHFAESIGINGSAVSRYIANKSCPGYNIQCKLYEIGLSIHWYISGSGSMFASNDKGVELQKSWLNASGESDSPFSRIKTWICENYDTIENFSSLWKEENSNLVELLYEQQLPGRDLLDVLEKAGCNISWISTGEGSSYADNNSGLLLNISKNRGNLDVWSYLNTGIIEKIKNLTKNELYRIILFGYNNFDNIYEILNEINQHFSTIDGHTN